MRFTHQELHGLGDAQQNFEQLEALLSKFAQGRATVTIDVAHNGLIYSPTLTIPHGLTIVPQSVRAMVRDSATPGAPIIAEEAQAPDLTNIYLVLVAGRTATFSTGQTFTVNWAANG